MSVNGFDINGTIEKYNYDELDNAPVSNGVGANSIAGSLASANAAISTAIGDNVSATGRSSFVVGAYNVADANEVDTTYGTGARKFIFIIGNGTADDARSNAFTVDWQGSVAAGSLTTASGNRSFAIGTNSIASGDWSFAGGNKSAQANDPTTASGNESFAFGLSAIASGQMAVAFGQTTTASGNMCLVSGNASSASGNSTLSVGQHTEAKAAMSTALGNYTKANGRACLVAGQYNIEDTNDVDTTYGSGARKYILIIGNGTADNARSNAFTVDWSGNGVFAGKLTVGTAPTNNMDVATKQYVDQNSGSDVYWVGINDAASVIEAAYQDWKIIQIRYSGRIYVLSERVSSTKFIFSSTSENDAELLVYDNGSWSIATRTLPTEVTVSSTGAVSQELDAGKVYHFTGSLTSLTITLNSAGTGAVPQYHFDFNCGSTAPTVTIPNTVTMPANNTFAANNHYEVDILNNYGVVASWPTS